MTTASGARRPTTRPDDVDDVVFKIAAAWRDLRRLKPLELSISMPLGQIDTMDAIARSGPCSMLEVSEALHVDASTATRAVEPLVQAGYVERRRSDRDARTVIVELSREGRRLERRLTEERLANVVRVLCDHGGFTDDELVVLADFLDRMVRGSVLALDEQPSS